MRIFQVLRRGASEYEKKSQRIDFELLRGEHELVTSNADITLNYANLDLPEAVEERYFSPSVEAGALARLHTFTPRRFHRRGVRQNIDVPLPRLHRTPPHIERL